MKRAYIWAVVFAALGIGLSALILFGAPMPLQIKLTLALGVGITLLYIGAAIVYLLALKGYKYQLKIAYRYICASMFLVSLGTLQFLFIGALNLLNSAWVVQGGAGLPFALMATFAYLGVRIFAKLVDVESAFTNIWIGQGVAVGVGIATLVATGHIGSSQPSFDIPMAMNSYQATALVITAILMIKIRRVTGPLYSSALNWSSVLYSILAVAGAAAVVTKLTLPANHWYNLYNVGTIPYFLGGLCVMIAALYFNRVAYAENIQSGLVSAAARAHQSLLTPVDVVVFLAGFASSKSRIDPILDKMRVITANMGPDKHLTRAQRDTLATVYLAVEDFLVNKETVRQYKRSELRQMIELRFRETVDEQFWQSVRAGHRLK